MASDRRPLDAGLARLLGEVAALFRREPRVTLVVRSPELPGGGELVVTGDDLRLAVRAIERQAGRANGAEGDAQRLRAALGAAAERLEQAAASFERLGLDGAAAPARDGERDARATLRKLREEAAAREEG